MPDFGAPVKQSLNLGLVKVPSGTTQPLVTVGGIALTGTCATSATAPTYVATISATTDEPGTWFSSMAFMLANVATFGPSDGRTALFTWDNGCSDEERPAALRGVADDGSIFLGGLEFTIAKPSGVVVSGILGMGVGAFGANASFTGTVSL